IDGNVIKYQLAINTQHKIGIMLILRAVFFNAEDFRITAINITINAITINNALTESSSMNNKLSSIFQYY
uniref:hypothetical protein n=1 Tax=Chryseobacterium cucumeris TaxID=1813611 RepID=UPI0023F3B24F